MDIKIEPILLDQKSVFVQLMQLYNYDFSEYEYTDVNEYGYYNYSNTDDLWNDPERHPYFIRVDGKLAGFVLVQNHCRFIDHPDAHNIDEFFVMVKYRRNGVGRYAASAIFDRYRGKWEVLQMPNNIRAQQFWKSVISEYTNGFYQTCGSMDEEWVGFLFDNAQIIA
ncbi:MAG TPA: GNAT family N-acetyltransferase [Anaerolineaceae bacterium]